MISHDPAVPHVPEYEEIQDLRQAMRHDGSVSVSTGERAQRADNNTSSGMAGEYVMKTDYGFTRCPAYAVTSTV